MAVRRQAHECIRTGTKLAIVTGFEPVTFPVTGGCSGPLSHTTGNRTCSQCQQRIDRMVWVAGFEPATSPPRTARSAKLSYTQTSLESIRGSKTFLPKEGRRAGHAGRVRTVEGRVRRVVTGSAGGHGNVIERHRGRMVISLPVSGMYCANGAGLSQAAECLNVSCLTGIENKCVRH